MTLENPRKRKNSAIDETPRKMFKVSTGEEVYTSCRDHISTVRSKKSNSFEQGGTLLDKKAKGLQELVLTKESSSTTLDNLTASSRSPLSEYLTEKQNLKERSRKRKAEDFQESENVKRVKTDNSNDETADSLRAKFRETYVEQTEIGEGGFGSVFGGYRVHDKLPVAIKHIQKDHEMLIHVDENGKQMPSEVAIMLKLMDKTSSSVGQSAIVSLLDWYDLGEELILVLERPMPAEDLFDYIKKHKGRITMKNAKIMIKQLLKAVIHLQEANIFHRDIKPENILIETKSQVPKLYLIDFGLSCFDDRKKYKYFCGTWADVPPEFSIQGFLSSGPTNVWQVKRNSYHWVVARQPYLFTIWNVPNVAPPCFDPALCDVTVMSEES
ncbi:serine/threonine-protein kinase pim-1-like [Cyprinodon tularosa]|uniref:serine/threonine-protein kinase pim-1-like n=1 Tax=Cyprinodon tularosa TaxID=77115 RepID=UPI0018E277F7|nr:serine/threonine-protein kinase pim-1-like [Cyprinodon tularosa]